MCWTSIERTLLPCQAVPWSTTDAYCESYVNQLPRLSFNIFSSLWDSRAFFHLTWIKISQKLVFREISFRS